MPPYYTAQEVMTTSAALLNDSAQSIFTNAVQLPYLKLAYREMRELMELGNVPKTNRVATLSAIAASSSITQISYVTTPALPSDLVDIRGLWERQTDTNPWTQMSRREFLPYVLDDQPTTSFMYFAWLDNEIWLPPSSSINDLKIDYIAQLTEIVDENSTIDVINGRSFLEYRTAALCAQFISEDKPRADDLNEDAGDSINRLEVIESKAKQAIFTRRRPFRQGYKARGRVW